MSHLIPPSPGYCRIKCLPTTELQLQFSEALDDAFHNLLTPIETDIDDIQRRAAIRAVSSDLAALRRRQI